MSTRTRRTPRVYLNPDLTPTDPYHAAAAGVSGKLRLNCEALGIHYSHMVSLDLPAGYTCPSAYLCKAFVHLVTGKVILAGEFECFAAKIEGFRKNVFANHMDNLKSLSRARVPAKMARLIIRELNRVPVLEYVRIGSSGDIFSRAYWNALKLIARAMPWVTFWGYTKELYVLESRPRNMHLAYSIGATPENDAAVLASGYKCLCYVLTEDDPYAEAARLGIEVVCDGNGNDVLKIIAGEPFGIPVH